MATKVKARAFPRIVTAKEWEKAHKALLRKEKAATRARDRLATQRRRSPVVPVDEPYVFEKPGGTATLLDLFEGRPQLIVYHFMFAPGVEGWPSAGCPGCSMVLDNLGQFALTHLAQRGVSFALVSRAPLANIEAYRRRMQWTAPWVSSAGNTFNIDFGLTTEEGETFGLSVFIRDGERIFRSYFTDARGVEALGTAWTFLDLTPFGRQEEWEDSPRGWPQTEPYEWWRRHDEYGKG
jgi:predicted dithiol-disulfide oxidoreductase (DUF899 family)